MGLLWLLLLAGTGAVFAWVSWAGSSLVGHGPPGDFGAAHAGSAFSPLCRMLLALATIMATAQALGAVCRRLGQPAVMGEVLGGILLGPSLLGLIAPGASAFLFPKEVVGALSSVAQIGVILYMFFVGIELDTKMLRSQGPATVLISHASIVAPFTLGSLLALLLYPRYCSPDVPFHVFTLFMGASMSVTAFPVLARILTDQKMQKSLMGSIALTCAAVDDVTAWCILAAVLAVATNSPIVAVQTLALTLLFVLLSWVTLRPWANSLAARAEKLGKADAFTLGLTLLLAVLSAAATEAIGIHALFGAFLLGVYIPHESVLARDVMNGLWNLVSFLLLPAFFAFTGLRTSIGLVHGAEAWLFLALIIGAACLGKFGGTFVAARWSGLPSREAASLGILMNTRGLMELIVLNLGLELKILSPLLFTMFVMMALVTTFATTPILQALRRGEDKAHVVAA